MRYRSNSGKLWGLFTSTDRERHDVLTCTSEGIGHVALPVHPDERAWLREEIAKADTGQPEPERSETPVEGLSRLMLDVLESLDEDGEGVCLEANDPLIEEALKLRDEIDARVHGSWNGGL